jgi:hypothetical protein
MRNKFSRKVFLLLFILCAIPIVVYAVPGGLGSTDYTNAPPNYRNCTYCHSSYPVNSGSGKLQLYGLPASYVANSTYSLTLHIIQSGQTRWGFQLKATAGTLVVTDSTNTSISSGFLNHKSAGTYAGQTVGQWNFNWTAPSVASATVKFYASGLAANNNGNEIGDYVYTIVSTLNPYIAPSEVYLNSYGEFTVSSDTSHWFFNVYGNASSAGTLLVNTTAGNIAISQAPGQKGQLTQIFSVPSTGWYTAKTRI